MVNHWRRHPNFSASSQLVDIKFWSCSTSHKLGHWTLLTWLLYSSWIYLILKNKLYLAFYSFLLHLIEVFNWRYRCCIFLFSAVFVNRVSSISFFQFWTSYSQAIFEINHWVSKLLTDFFFNFKSAFTMGNFINLPHKSSTKKQDIPIFVSDK